MQRKRRKGKKGKGRKKNVNPLFQLVPGKKKDSRKKAGRLPKVPLFDEEAAADDESLYSEPALPPVRRARAVSAPWRCAQRRGVRMKVRDRSPQIPRDFSRTFSRNRHRQARQRLDCRRKVVGTLQQPGHQGIGGARGHQPDH
jgi:hypothetical protein